MRPIASLALVFGLVTLAPSLDTAARPLDDRFERLVTFAAGKMKEYGVPGAAIGVLDRQTRQVRGLGVTNIDHPLPVTETTLFQVGSISKTFLGTAMMRLVEQRRIDLEAPVHTYLPSFRVHDREVSRTVTIADLLTHMGGWEGDIFEDTGAGDDALEKYVQLLKDVEQVAPLRSVYSYNNAGFNVAGRVIEAVTGQSYEDALTELVYQPLALKQTYIRPADVMTLRFVVGHGREKDQTAVQTPWPIGRSAHPAGGVIATVPDLLTYAQFHLGDGTAGGTRVLGNATLQAMHRTRFTKQATNEEMAVTWHVSRAGALRRLAHGGATVGQQALLTLIPERQFAVTLVTNSSRGSRLNQDVTRWALKEYLGVDDPEPSPLQTQPEPNAYGGRYTRPFADVRVSVENGGLIVQSIPKRGFPDARAPVPPPGPAVPYAFYAPDRAIATGGPSPGSRIEFVRAPDGSIGWVRAGGRIHRRAGGTS